MKFLANVPETPIIENWQWRTDTIVSDNGTEQRISLCEFPKRSLELNIGVDTEADMVAITRTLMLSGAGLLVPFYQAATRLKADYVATEYTIQFDASRTDLRDGGEALIFDAQGRTERVTLDTVAVDGATLTEPLAGVWGRSASICPVWGMASSGALGLTRRNVDRSGDLKLALVELEFMEPFANEFAPYIHTMFGGYPVLAVNSIGQQFEQNYDTGLQTIDYGGVIELRNPWTHAQIVMPRMFQCNRVSEPASWNMWRSLADYARGSANPFYVPTFREDFVRISNTAATVTFAGSDYAEDFAPFAPFRQFAFFLEDGGVHYAAVSNCVVVGGNSVATFAPALPNGAVVRKASMLLKVRIADDRISCEHRPLETILSINLRTAD
jgi:hypothetical protein